MRIAFVSKVEPNNIGGSSDTPYCMSKTLEISTDFSKYIHASECNWKIVLQGGKNGQTELIRNSYFVSDKLKDLNIDAVIYQGSGMIPYMDTNDPIVIRHDSTSNYDVDPTTIHVVPFGANLDAISREYD